MTDSTLFKHIVEECITTNNLRPEYEMWLYQEIYRFKDSSNSFREYLLKLTPDSFGWIMWFLYKVEMNTLIADEYLQKSNQYGNKYGICKYMTEAKLLEETKKGNIRAFADLHLILTDINTQKSIEYLQLGIRAGDFMCIYMYVNSSFGYHHWSGGIHGICMLKATEWGYHYEKRKDKPDYLMSYTMEHKERYEYETKKIGENLLNLGIPCAYYFLAKDTNEYTEMKNLNNGKSKGCSCCNLLMKEKSISYNKAYAMMTKIKNLEKLQSHSTEDIVKSVISEYL